MQQEKVKERTASPNTTNSMMSHSDTICALATATGGALGIIRISGPQAFGAVSAITAIHCAECEGNTLHYTCVKDGTETPIGFSNINPSDQHLRHISALSTEQQAVTHTEDGGARFSIIGPKAMLLNDIEVPTQAPPQIAKPVLTYPNKR
jgi:hypothetical protein